MAGGGAIVCGANGLCTAGGAIIGAGGICPGA